MFPLEMYFKQGTDGILPVDVEDGPGKEFGHGELDDLEAGLGPVVLGDGVGDHQAF
jgi:hypothetical protein